MKHCLLFGFARTFLPPFLFWSHSSMSPSNITSHQILRPFLSVVFLFFFGDVCDLWLKGRRCIRQRRLLLSIPSYNKVYIHLHQLVVGQRFSPSQTMQFPPSMTKWTCCGNCISSCMDSDYIRSENSPLIHSSCTGQGMDFLKCEAPLPLNSSTAFPPASSNQLWSPAHFPYSRGIGSHTKTQPNIFDFRVLIWCIVSLMVNNLGIWECAWKLV